MTITLTPDQERAIRDAIVAGEVGSIEELIDRAIAGLPRRESPFASSRRADDNLHKFLLNSPLRGANLDLERAKDYPRPLDLE